jgi:TatD DNase family protein
MFVDSHCHLDFPELSAQLDTLLANMAASQVTHALCISVNRTDWPKVMALAEQHANLYATVGVHPDHDGDAEEEVDEAYLLTRARHPRVLAIGETGLDYYRLTGELDWQRERFRTHIRAANACRKPLVIHTRSASADTLRIMREESAANVGGVMHCFTETQEVAQAAIDMGFYISFSGIVSFKNAHDLRAVAQYVPLDRILIETDSPYLAPVPFRGKVNQPAYVKHVAEALAQVKGVTVEQIAAASTRNFFELFHPS